MTEDDYQIHHFLYLYNQSNCAFYQSKGLVDWSLGEPLCVTTKNSREFFYTAYYFRMSWREVAAVSDIEAWQPDCAVDTDYLFLGKVAKQWLRFIT